ncbi:hypothetical protein WJX81_005879 [Elliptochloris bilobata]|uniref:Nucleoporin Nup54 alpha-helical domain-containing protein n=2 Tax=Elliptochloris bilobata TaxID=381761 RepID=A0AAW1S6E0_9CHLO
MASFSFGTPAASGAFGTPASSAAPAFGASSSGLFGGASAGAFSFGGSQQPGSAPSLFGAQPASAPSLFGAQPAASAPSLFGAQPAASTPSLFGAQPAASAPPLFGASSAPAFGAAGGFGGFGFGASAPAAASQPGLFGAPAQPQTQMAPATFASGLAAQPDLGAARDLEALREAYTPGAPRHRFQHLLLNVVDTPAARVKPPGVDELRWREALQRAGGPDNSQHLWPVPAVGFSDLLARRKAQDEAVREHNERLQVAASAVRQLARRQETCVKERLEAVRRRHLELCMALLRILRHVDLLEGRFAAACGCAQPGQRTAVAELARELAKLEATVAPHAPGGLEARVEALAAAARLRAGAPAASGAAEEAVRLDAASLAHLGAVLGGHAEALGRLQAVLRRDDRDLAVLAREKKRAAGGVQDMYF